MIRKENNGKNGSPSFAEFFSCCLQCDGVSCSPQEPFPNIFQLLVFKIKTFKNEKEKNTNLKVAGQLPGPCTLICN